ncbi:MAG: hydantoinase/oxoprolinase family protein [Streptosporangiales bacterium]|nr:hydantoinase/oxoprolinase family protein [Streptosporangiales bacterium]
MTSGLRIGIDVGGTHTDAVAVDPAGRLRATAKVPTTADVSSGIRRALAEVLAAVTPERPGYVMLGSTHAVNALLRHRGLHRVAALRLGGPGADRTGPFTGWPGSLRRAVEAGAQVVAGEVGADGGEAVPFDAAAVARFFGSLAGRAEAVAITGVYAPASARHELLAERIARRELGPAVPISLSHEVGGHGLLERENATVLNAALAAVAGGMATALRRALVAHGLGSVPAYVTQNDGTLMRAEYATRLPIRTVGGGPANSLRGAAHLTGLRDALVADVGGASTDVGVLSGGAPREAAGCAWIGGVAIDARMPGLVSVAVGGGTIVHRGRREVSVGPGSIGYDLSRRALVFGGGTATLTDAAVAAGRAAIGHRMPPAGQSAMLRRALAVADERVLTALARVGPGRGRPLIVVGGAGALVPARPEVVEVLRPAYGAVAGAVGAAVGHVGGEADRVAEVSWDGRERAIGEARELARSRAVSAGADPRGVRIVEMREIPLPRPYERSVRITVKAAGPVCG